jgi:hypothetical protein
MIKPKFIVTAVIAILFFTKVNAQVDTTHFDLGRIQLKKDFTQSITVKGEDLQRMPFDNLADAINVWFYGGYTNTTNIVYVVDGNLVNDANAYSIYDIDEVTLVQSALTQIAGTSQQQQLILIKTKRAKTKGSGVTASGQANISSVYTNNIPTTPILNNGVTEYPNTYQTGIKSTTTVYQQYYVSAYQNTGNMQFGASADYLTDGLPQIKNSAESNSQRINRLRLNGYFDAKVGRSMLDVTAGYTPQTGKDVYDATSQYSDYNGVTKQSDHLFNGTVKLTTNIFAGLVNVIHADYNNYRGDDNGTALTINTYTTPENYITKTTNYSHTIIAYDNLSYDAKFGDWGLEPAVNLNFRSFKDSTFTGNYNYVNNDLSSESYSTSWMQEKDHRFELTPSLNLYYKSYFNIQGGLLYSLIPASYYTKPDHKLFPFVLTSFDVMHLIDPTSTVTIKGYITYAINPTVPDNFSQLPDFNNTTILHAVDAYTNTIVLEPMAGNSGTYYANYNTGFTNSVGTYNTFTAGLTVSPEKSGLSFNYFYEKSSYMSNVEIFVYAYPNTESEFFNPSTNSILHRFGIDYKLTASKLNWNTGISATMIKQTYLTGFGTSPVVGNNQWTGGWVNRLTCLDFFAGADLLYQLGENVYAMENGKLVTSKINSFSLQNLYAGYHLKIKGLKNPEAFANARNIFQNKKEDITDDRKYIGLGFKLSL